ncbi:ROK family protein [Cohnella suwonensis]|uniref:ROK family protein n=1 Tax=Cohnella suwonensis TaxID=696072 RepID=A0ABW0M246_9BACL
MDKKVYAGIDLGGTKILAVLTDENGTKLRHAETSTNAAEGEEAVIGRMIALLREMLEPGEKLASIGVATAGTLNAAEGIVATAANLGWHQVPLGKKLENAFGVPVRLENDANAAAYGEWAAGAGKGTQDCVYVTVSTGIGAGIVSSGKLIRGRDSSAGELGHITLDWNGPRCPCGNVGCVELYASGTAIGRAGQRLAAERPEEAATLLAIAGGAAITSRHVAEAAAAGDGLSLGVLREAGRALGTALVSIIHMTNPEAIVLGGGASAIGEPLLGPMREAIADLGIASMAADVRIVSPLLGKEAGAIGAALLVAKG